MVHIHLHKGDLEFPVDFGSSVAVDTESMGLRPKRDRLCVVQLFSPQGGCHLVQFEAASFHAPFLKSILENPDILKIFHFARADVYTLNYHLNTYVFPLFCTKIASKLSRTYTDRHGLKNLCKDILGIELNKEEQSSNWGAGTLSEPQKKYASGDVLYLHSLKDALTELLAQEGRTALAQQCFDFIPTCALLDQQEFDTQFILSY